MKDSLGNLLALVAEGKLTRAQAKSAAAGMWLNGAITAEDLAEVAVEIQKVWDEAETARYVESVVKRSWPEIEQIARSPFLEEATKKKIRTHPEAVTKRQAFKATTFGLRSFTKYHEFGGPRRGDDRADATAYSLQALVAPVETWASIRDSWLSSWPAIPPPRPTPAVQVFSIPKTPPVFFHRELEDIPLKNLEFKIYTNDTPRPTRPGVIEADEFFTAYPKTPASVPSGKLRSRRAKSGKRSTATRKAEAASRSRQGSHSTGRKGTPARRSK